MSTNTGTTANVVNTAVATSRLQNLLLGHIETQSKTPSFCFRRFPLDPLSDSHTYHVYHASALCGITGPGSRFGLDIWAERVTDALIYQASLNPESSGTELLTGADLVDRIATVHILSRLSKTDHSDPYVWEGSDVVFAREKIREKLLSGYEEIAEETYSAVSSGDQAETARTALKERVKNFGKLLTESAQDLIQFQLEHCFLDSYSSRLRG